MKRNGMKQTKRDETKPPGTNRIESKWNGIYRKLTGRTEPNRTEPNRTEPNRTEPNRTEPNRTEPTAPYLSVEVCRVVLLDEVEARVRGSQRIVSPRLLPPQHRRLKTGANARRQTQPMKKQKRRTQTQTYHSRKRPRQDGKTYQVLTSNHISSPIFVTQVEACDGRGSTKATHTSDR